jgi:hypothetical protein
MATTRALVVRLGPRLDGADTPDGPDKPGDAAAASGPAAAGVAASPAAEPGAPHTLAMAMANVRRVVVAPALTPVPTAPPVVLGLANVRGVVVPVLDTGLLLDRGPVAGAPFAVVVETARGFAALAVPEMPVAQDVDEADVADIEALVAP